jgi:hypothetical protein
MPDALDLDLARVHVVGGRPQPDDPPGLTALAAPRKAARGREKDVLILCLGLRARAPESAPAERYADLLDLAAAVYFGTPGSVTAALRTALNAVNQSLIEANLRAGPTGAVIQGGLICAALKGDSLYAVQSGPGIVVVAHGLSLERFPNLPSRPLGASVALDAQYFHTLVHEGEYLCLSSTLPPGWSDATLAGLGGLATLSAVAERLKNASTGDFAALLGRFEPPGTVGALQPAPAPATIPRPLPAAEAVRAASPALTVTSIPPAPAADSVTRPSSTPVVGEVTPPAAESGSAARDPNTNWPDLMRRAEKLGGAPAAGHVPVIDATAAPPAPPKPQTWRDRLALLTTPLSRAFAVTLAEASRGLRVLLARMMPEGVMQRDGLFAIPTSVQVGAAILIPLLVVSVVAALYWQRGRSEQFAANLEQAQLEIQGGRLAPDNQAARPHWEQALDWIARAEQFKPGDAQLAALRAEAQGRLDELDWVTRLDFKPLVVGGLGRGVQVKQMVLVGPDVYALDGARNRVLHIAPTPGGGYAVDPEFECAAGTIGQFTIGQLIDLAVVPGPNALGGGDAIVALDSAGGLLYCAPAARPLATYLPAPDSSWIRPAALEVYADRLYVLDPGGNEVWQFQSSGGAFSQPPTHYFTSVSYDLKDVIDFAIAQGDLFLMRKDGRVTTCSRSSGQAACTEFASFTDPREGHVSGDRLYDVAAPEHLVYDPPPEPSLYLLDAANAGVYQLSLKLSFARQFRPRNPLGAPLTAVAIDSSKRVFVAAGDSVYVANRP